MAAPEGEQRHVERAYTELDDVDIIHDHTLHGLLRTDLHPPGVPVVTTAHGPFTTEMADLFRIAAAGGVGIVAVSHAQRNSAPDLPVMAVIHHGVDVSQFPFGHGDGGYVLVPGADVIGQGRTPGDRGRSGGRAADRAGCEDVGTR